MPLITVPTDKNRLAIRGGVRMARFCEANDLPLPVVQVCPPEDWHWDACAFYRTDKISICLEHCAWPCGVARSRAWSWPGSTIDREPYGVLCHELGHHIDYHASRNKGSYGGDYSVQLREESGEAPISGYCPNDWEWSAEMMRLFITNHALLRLVRHKTWNLLSERWKPVSSDNWLRELGANVPPRVVAAQRNKFDGYYGETI